MVLDYSNPEDPALLATLVLAQDALDLVVRDGYVFAALKTAGFAVVDVHDPEDPEVVALLDTPGSATAIDLGPRLAFVADGSAGLTVIDASNPLNPSFRGSIDTPGNCVDVVYRAHSAYVADGDSDLHRIDVSNAQAPAIVQTVSFPGEIHSVTLVDDVHLFSAGYGLRHFFIDSQENMTGLDTLFPAHTFNSVTGFAHGVAVANDFILSTSFFLDVENPQTPEPLSVLSGIGGSITIENGIAYVSSNEIRIIDVSNPENPVELSSIDIPGGGGKTVLEEGLLYCQDYFGFGIVDVSDPMAPALLSYIPIDVNPLDVALWNHHAFLTTYEGGMKILNVADPSAPFQVGSWNSAGFVEQIEVRDGFAYITDHCTGGERGCYGFNIVDVHDPTAPLLVGVAPIGGGYSLLLFDNYAVVNGFALIEVTNPQAPEIVSGFNGLGAIEEIDGDIAYLRSEAAILAVNFSDPASPSHLGQIFYDKTFADIEVENGIVWATTGELDPVLAAFPTHCSASTGVPLSASQPMGLTVIPNPSSGAFSFVVDAGPSGWIDLAIFDVQGRLVRRLRENAISQMKTQLRWDGRDANAEMASPGTYFIRSKTAAGTSVTKATLLR